MLRGLESLYETVPWDLLAHYSIERPTNQISELNERLPAAFTEGCIEWPLAADADGIDIWATIPYDADGRVTCAKFLRRRAIAGPDGWAGLDRVLRDWVEPECAAHDLIGDLFLEFDLGRDTHGLQPIVVASLIGPPASATAARRAFSCYQALVLGRRVDAASNLRSLLENLPQSAVVRNIALMPRGGLTLTRLSIWMNVMSVVRCIELLDMKVATKKVRDVLECISHRTTLIGLQVDLGRVDTIGMEIALPPHMYDPDHFRHLLDLLETEASCDAAKRQLIERWIQGIEIGRIYRNLIIKVNVSPDGQLLSKAYLVFSPMPDQ